MVEVDLQGQKEDIQNLTNSIQAWSLEVSLYFYQNNYPGIYLKAHSKQFYSDFIQIFQMPIHLV